MPEIKRETNIFIRVDIGCETKSGYVFNCVFFKDGTTAYEKAFEPNGTDLAKPDTKTPLSSLFSKFSSCKPGDAVVFDITHPGYSGKPNWIQYVSLKGPACSKINFEQKDILIMAQNAATAASRILAASISTTNNVAMVDDNIELYSELFDKLHFNICQSISDNAKKMMEINNKLDV